jgi:hypothetical protein
MVTIKKKSLVSARVFSSDRIRVIRDGAQKFKIKRDVRALP